LELILISLGGGLPSASALDETYQYIEGKSFVMVIILLSNIE